MRFPVLVSFQVTAGSSVVTFRVPVSDVVKLGFCYNYYIKVQTQIFSQPTFSVSLHVPEMFVVFLEKNLLI